MLDNRRMAMVEDADVRNFRPTFVIGEHGVMRYADAPLLADAAGNQPCGPARREFSGRRSASPATQARRLTARKL